MSFFSEMEKNIERGFRRWTEKMFGPADSDALVLVHRGILEEIEGRIQPGRRGKPLFPFNHLVIHVRRPEFAPALERLEGDIRDCLAAAGCEVPAGFAVEVTAGETAGPFEIDYQMRQRTQAPARLVLMRGAAARSEYELNRPRINIGRLPELLDRDQRVLARNEIVFEEGADEVNATVSRRHAHVRAGEGGYWVCDDGSEYGTRIFREGRAIDVPPGSSRGERLRAGDEIYFGRACLRFEA